MTLDLDELVGPWDCPQDDVAARVIQCDDGERFVQLRVDLGILQMRCEGRPDGGVYQELPTALEYVRHERACGAATSDDELEALERELEQFNFRRLAFSSLADGALRDGQQDTACEHLQAALRDIEHCLHLLRLLDTQSESDDESQIALYPTLVFNRARYKTRLCIVEQRFEDAIETAADGEIALRLALEKVGYDPEGVDEDPGVQYLHQLEKRLRDQHGISATLSEQIDEALAREDYEQASELRDRLHSRRGATRRKRLPPPTDTPPGE